MSQVVARIAHISDLHFGWSGWPSYFSPALAEHLRDHLSTQKPDLVVCTGDVVNGPLSPLAYIKAKRFFSDVQKACGDNCRILLVPGNHDVSLLGILGLKSLAMWLLRKGLGEFRPQEGVRFLSELGVTFFGFDSNPPFFIRPDFPRLEATFLTLARGEVSDKAIKTFSAKVADLKSEGKKAFSESFKIAALHHHPLPIPYSGSDVYLVLVNAGSLLVELAKHQVDLILHGHKHYTAFSRVIINVDGRDYEIAVLGAGSATKIMDHEPKGNSYNLITIWSDGMVTSQQFVVQQGGTFAPIPGEPTVCQSTETAGQKAFTRALADAEWCIGSCGMKLQVNEWGDAIHTFELKDCRVLPERVTDSFVLERSTDFGYYRDFTFTDLSGNVPGARPTTTYDRRKDPTGSAIWSTARCQLDLGREVTSLSEPINFSLELPLYAAFAMDSEEQAERGSPYVRGMEGTRITICYPAEEVSVSIDVEGYDFSETHLDLAILDARRRRQERLEKAARHELKTDAGGIRLRLVKPRVGWDYEVRWRLKDRPPAELELGVPTLAAGWVKVLRRELLRNRGPDSNLYAELKGTLERIVHELRGSFPSIDREEQFDASFMVYDEESKCLVIISSLFPPDSKIWGWALPPGFGICGRAFKTNRVTIYFRSARSREESAIYIGPGDPLAEGYDLFQHEVLIAAPIQLGGSERQHTLGVLNLGTNSPASGLYGALAEQETSNRLLAWIAEQEVWLVGRLVDLLLGGQPAGTAGN